MRMNGDATTTTINLYLLKRHHSLHHQHSDTQLYKQQYKIASNINFTGNKVNCKTLKAILEIGYQKNVAQMTTVNFL